jgi:hypothetical protein
MYASTFATTPAITKHAPGAFQRGSKVGEGTSARQVTATAVEPIFVTDWSRTPGLQTIDVVVAVIRSGSDGTGKQEYRFWRDTAADHPSGWLDDRSGIE